MSEPIPLKCCYVDPVDSTVSCPRLADWELHYGTGFEDHTHACSGHLGFMLTDAEEHRVYRLHPNEPLQEQPPVIDPIVAAAKGWHAAMLPFRSLSPEQFEKVEPEAKRGLWEAESSLAIAMAAHS